MMSGITGANLDDLVLFNSQLATVVRSGLPLDEGIRNLSKEVRSSGFRHALTSISEDMQNGVSLSESMESSSFPFPSYYITLLKAGEESGNLSDILLHLTWYSRWRQSIRRRLINAITYPLIIASLAGVILAAILIFLVPKFEAIYSGFGAQLPQMTMLLVILSNLIVNNPLILLLPLLLAALFVYLSWTGRLRHWFDGVLLLLPIFGRHFRNQHLARFCVTISTMLKSRVSLPRALRVLAGSADGAYFKNVLNKVASGVEDGQSLSSEMAKHRLFPASLSWIVKNGEMREDLPTVLEESGKHYDHMVNDFGMRLIYIAAPIAVIIVGIVVGFMVIALYMPIFKLVSVIR